MKDRNKRHDTVHPPSSCYANVYSNIDSSKWLENDKSFGIWDVFSILCISSASNSILDNESSTTKELVMREEYK
jgi:hypothetical protein